MSWIVTAPSRIAAAATVAVLLASAVSAAEVMDRVLAVVAGDLILLSDVRAARDLGLEPTDPAAADPDREVLARLIDRALVLAEVDRFAPPEPDARSVDEGVAAITNRFTSPDALNAALARAGIEERHLRERVRQDLRMAAYLDQRFTGVPPTEDEIQRAYRDRLAEFTTGGEARPLDAVRAHIVQRLAAERRRSVVGDWLAGLRRRGDVRVVE